MKHLIKLQNVSIYHTQAAEIEKYAAAAGFVDFFKYPRGKHDRLDFSFSGLKTAVLYDMVNRGAYCLNEKKFLIPDNINLNRNVASSLLVCMRDIFVQKLELILKKHPQVRSVSFVGGVACNKYYAMKSKPSVS